MNRIFVIAAVLLPFSVFAGIIEPGSYEECLLDRMEDAKTNRSAAALVSVCKKYRPISLSGTSHPYFFPDDFDECMSEYIGRANSERGASYIRYACNEMTAKHNKDDCTAYLGKVRTLNPEAARASNKELLDALLSLSREQFNEDVHKACK